MGLGWLTRSVCVPLHALPEYFWNGAGLTEDAVCVDDCKGSDWRSHGVISSGSFGDGDTPRCPSSWTGSQDRIHQGSNLSSGDHKDLSKTCQDHFDSLAQVGKAADLVAVHLGGLEAEAPKPHFAPLQADYPCELLCFLVPCRLPPSTIPWVNWSTPIAATSGTHTT